MVSHIGSHQTVAPQVITKSQPKVDVIKDTALEKISSKDSASSCSLSKISKLKLGITIMTLATAVAATALLVLNMPIAAAVAGSIMGVFIIASIVLDSLGCNHKHPKQKEESTPSEEATPPTPSSTSLHFSEITALVNPQEIDLDAIARESAALQRELNVLSLFVLTVPTLEQKKRIARTFFLANVKATALLEDSSLTDDKRRKLQLIVDKYAQDRNSFGDKDDLYWHTLLCQFDGYIFDLKY